MKKLFLLLPLALIACNDKKTETPKTETVLTTKTISKPAEAEEIAYTRYKADSIKYDSIPNFYKNSSYKLGNRILVEGYYAPTESNFTPPDTKDDNGHRLMLFDLNKKLLYRSKGQGDVYVYEPNFFKNPENGKVVIFARLGYEYNFGGDAYLLEDGHLKYMGNLDVEPNTEDYSTVDILKITEKDNQFKFSFKADSLIFDPASGYPKAVKNRNFYYLYDGKKMKPVK